MLGFTVINLRDGYRTIVSKQGEKECVEREREREREREKERIRQVAIDELM